MNESSWHTLYTRGWMAYPLAMLSVCRVFACCIYSVLYELCIEPTCALYDQPAYNVLRLQSWWFMYLLTSACMYTVSSLACDTMSAEAWHTLQVWSLAIYPCTRVYTPNMQRHWYDNWSMIQFLLSSLLVGPSGPIIECTKGTQLYKQFQTKCSCRLILVTFHVFFFDKQSNITCTVTMLWFSQ